MNKRTIYLLAFLFPFMITYAGTPSDSLSMSSLYSFELLNLINPWLNTSNPAGLHFNEGMLPGRINLSYGLEKGDYKRIQQGNTFNHLSFQSQSYSTIKDLNIFGKFSYEKSFEKGLDFSNTNSPYRGTPYGMIDTLGNDNYNREFFFLNGAISKPVGLSVFGLAYDFGVGVSVQYRDPRPQNKVLDISIRPGYIYSLQNLKIGLNLIYEHFNEEIDIDIVKENTYMTIFRILGPGVSFSQEAKSFNRLYSRNSAGFEMQLNHLTKNINSLIGARLLYYTETVSDGGKGGDASWSYLRKISELKGADLKLFGNIKLSNGLNNHKIYSDFNIITSTGIEKLTKLVQIGILDSQDWIFFMDDPKYCSEYVEANIKYSFIQMKNSHQQNFSLTLGGNYNSFNQKYYIPFQNEKYDNSITSLNGTKTFYRNHSQLMIGGGLKFKKNLGGDQDFETVNFIYDKILLPDFLYLTSDYYAPSVNITCEIPLSKLFDKFYLDTKAELYKGSNGQSRTIASFSTGLIF